MGVFDVHCRYSGIPLIGDTQLFLLAEHNQRWKVISAPFRGSYDRYGRIEVTFNGTDSSKSRFDAFIAWTKEHFGLAEFEQILERMFDGDFIWRGHKISYSLVDAAVYDALPHALTPTDPGLPECLQCPWKGALGAITPTDFEDSDQYCGYEGKYGCRSIVELALTRFANNPAVVAAIKRNASEWQEIDKHH
jgi:hypothetical protein